MIETCLDIAGHIISDCGFRVPDSYADTFKILQENDIIEKKLLDALIQMAKFRNIVVHHYGKIDSEIVVTILRNNLQDFDKYKDSVIDYLKASKS